jgi:hypothetical protein
MIGAGTLTFLWSPLSIVASVILVAATATFCFIAWQRSGYARGTGLLEALRLIIVTLVVITLSQPEWLEEILPDERPTLAVLYDVSQSMQTQDVIAEDMPTQPPLTREEAIEPLLAKEVWAPLASKLDIEMAPFPAAEDNRANGTDLAGPLAATLSNYKNLRGVVLLSDGDWNMGEPPARAAARLRTKGVPVFPMAVGSESRLPDIEFARADAPTFGVVGKPTRIPIIIESALPRDYGATITLTPNRGEAVTKQVTIPAMGQFTDSLSWTAQTPGDYELTVNVPAHPDERVHTNNTLKVPIAIREEALKVLLVESLPRWEYRYLRNALERDPGVEVSCLLFHPGLSKVGGGKGYIKAFPSTLDELTQYDVVFLGDVGVGGEQLTVEDCRLIKGFVHSHAGGLVYMPGLRGAHLSLADTELDELYPVVLNAAQPRGWGARIPSQFELTETGRRSLLTRLEDSADENSLIWETLPGFQWYAPVLRNKAGSEVLATHKTDSNRFGRIPLLVTKTYGTGKILFMGTDAAWRWREGVEDKYHYRFWGQVARWMAYQRSMAQGESMRLFYTPDRPQAGDVVTLNANVMSTGGDPLADGKVIVQIVSPSGKTQSVRLSPSGDEWGLFSGTFVPGEGGTYQLALTSGDSTETMETTLNVQGAQRERVGRPARTDVLEEIASVTRGRMVEPGKFQGLLEEIAALPEPDPIVRRLRLWCHPLWAGLMVTLLGLFWTGRKMVGVI